MFLLLSRDNLIRREKLIKDGVEHPALALAWQWDDAHTYSATLQVDFKCKFIYSPSRVFPEMRAS